MYTPRTSPIAKYLFPDALGETSIMTDPTKHTMEETAAMEKDQTVHVERNNDLETLPDPDEGKTAEERAAIVGSLPTRSKQHSLTSQDRKLMRKVDRWMIPWLCLLYLLSFLDRTNIGNARLAGLEADLGMRGHDYNKSLTIFFASPSNAQRIVC